MPTPVEFGTQQDAAQVERALLAALRARQTQGHNSDLTLVVRSPANPSTVQAGLTGSTAYGWLLIKTLWVDATQRGRGIGGALMDAAECEARARGCHAAWLDTSNPDARRFYERRGYAVFGELANGPAAHPSDHVRWFLSKPLTD
ncbi:MAG: GNAT family N-acetyltransferase [Pseudomonadota bacterium]